MIHPRRPGHRDCGSNSCRYAEKRGGMRVNGPCRCDDCPTCGASIRQGRPVGHYKWCPKPWWSPLVVAGYAEARRRLIATIREVVEEAATTPSDPHMLRAVRLANRIEHRANSCSAYVHLIPMAAAAGAIIVPLVEEGPE